MATRKKSTAKQIGKQAMRGKPTVQVEAPAPAEPPVQGGTGVGTPNRKTRNLSAPKRSDLNRLREERSRMGRS